ncbi:MAG: DUF86 domain-containing protein [Coriobacteriales bacterium]|jgi:uncharacterized protein with HEPN domain|nr:DUF86 domain-containing protein [Coriobacteriales bacterium]
MKDQSVYLGDALESLQLVFLYTDGVEYEAFLVLPEKQDGVLYRIAMIGEALAGTSADFRELHPEIPWREIIGMRNILVHDYGNVDLQRVWETVNNDLKVLQEHLLAIFKTLTN